MQADDLLATNNFISIGGESEWQLRQPEAQPGTATTDQAPIPPNSSWATGLKVLNNCQSLLDARKRADAVLRTQMFDLWWKLIVNQGRTATMNLEDMKKTYDDILTFYGEDPTDENARREFFSKLAVFVQEYLVQDDRHAQELQIKSEQAQT